MIFNASSVMGIFNLFKKEKADCRSRHHPEPTCECGGPRYVGTRLGKYTVQCKCGIIYEDDLCGSYRDRNQELARDPKLQHSYSTDPDGNTTACFQCDAGYGREDGRQPCLNPKGDEILTKFLRQSGWVQHNKENLDGSIAKLKQVSEQLPRQPCPKCRGQDVDCEMCGGSGVIGEFIF